MVPLGQLSTKFEIGCQVNEKIFQQFQNNQVFCWLTTQQAVPFPSPIQKFTWGQFHKQFCIYHQLFMPQHQTKLVQKHFVQVSNQKFDRKKDDITTEQLNRFNVITIYQPNGFTLTKLLSIQCRVQIIGTKTYYYLTLINYYKFKIVSKNECKVIFFKCNNCN